MSEARVWFDAGLRRTIEAAFQAVRDRAVAELAGEVLENILDQTPVEQGRSHETWLTAGEQAAAGLQHGDRLLTCLARHQPQRSKEPNVAQGGLGWVDPEQRGVVTVHLEAEHEFMEIIEYGGMLQPIDPGGRKPEGTHFPGPFLLPRTSSGMGVLMWEENGTKRVSRTKSYQALHALPEAIRRVAALATSRGGKVV